MTIVIPRSAWGPSYGDGGTGRALRNELVTHITVNRELPATASMATEMAAMRGIERYVVQQRGFSGFPYSFCGFQSGRIYEGRGWRQDGAHTQRGRNQSAYALARYGDPNVEPSAAFLAAGRALCAEGIARGFLTSRFVLSGHRDHWPKACPGDPLYRRREELRPGSGGVTLPEQEDERMEYDPKGEKKHQHGRVRELQHAASLFLYMSGGGEDLGGAPHDRGGSHLKVDGVLGDQTVIALWHVHARLRLRLKRRNFYLDHQNPSSIFAGYLCAENVRMLADAKAA